MGRSARHVRPGYAGGPSRPGGPSYSPSQWQPQSPHQSPQGARLRARRRVAVALGAAAVALAGIAGAGVVLTRSGTLGARLSLSASSGSASSDTAQLLKPTVGGGAADGAASGGGASQGPGVVVPLPATAPLTLSRAQRQHCPAAATACVDLADRITWLQDGSKVTFGPVRMEPGAGAQGTAHATPIGTWTVAWKADANYVSQTYGEAMPWATFFAPGGVAFHGGSLIKASHGCVHLTTANAKYYHDHLPVGAEVVVF